jgi:16S rRNA (uracil1498-N3)-methyltransferase
MNIFYSADALLNTYVFLDEVESRHIATVLRKNVGDSVFVFDGKGVLFNAEILAIDKRKGVQVLVKSVESEQNNKPAVLHIAVAPPKNIERFEWLLEKVTEIGVHEITPVICKHSERRELRTDRLQKILLSACKQSLKFKLPVLHESVQINVFLQDKSLPQNKIIAHATASTQHFNKVCKQGASTVVLIGPEGDFSTEEIQLAIASGFHPATLGDSRLRLETAAVYTAAAFSILND